MLQAMAYPGGKAGDGVYQRLISLMPPHEVYIEPFLGGGALMRLKRPARLNIGLDLDPKVIRHCQGPTAENDDTAGSIVRHDEGRFQFRHADGIAFLQSYPFTGRELVYCDPPYVLSTRTSRQYRHEMTDDQHAALLETIQRLPCMVMISEYWTALYAEALRGWHVTSYQAMTRSGRMATVVAPGFESGAIETRCAEQQVTPMKARDLGKLLEYTVEYGAIPVTKMREMFQHYHPNAVSKWVEELEKWLKEQRKLTIDIFLNALEILKNSMPDLVSPATITLVCRQNLKAVSVTDSEVVAVAQRLSILIPDLIGVDDGKIVVNASATGIADAVKTQLEKLHNKEPVETENDKR
jgi:hypothetical protein